MRRDRFIAIAALSLVAVWLIARAPDVHGQAPSADALAIVVHRGNPTDTLTAAELRRIFMLETQSWPHGRRITVVLREKGQPERDEAIRLICGLSEAEYERNLLLQTFRGVVTRGPRSIQSATGMLRFIFNTPGAIGYVPAGEVDDSVKVVAIDARLPGDPEYPLQRRARIGRVNWLPW
jgi:ABC-type phosphate transport system substrate-binding protein